MVRSAATAVVALLLAASPAGAQYFGRNKIQYEDFDFHRLDTGHFAVFTYLEDPAAQADVAGLAELWYRRLRTVFEDDLDEDQPLILYADDADFQQTNVIGSFIRQGVGGVTEGMRNRIVLPLTGLRAADEHVIGHELTHAFQFRVMKDAARAAGGRSPVSLWFVEGMAEYLSIGREDPLTAMWLRDAVLRDDVPGLDELGDPKRFPYRWGHAVWAWFAAQKGDQAVVPLFRKGLEIGPVRAMREALGEKDTDELNERWRRDVEAACRPALAGRTRPRETGRAVPSEGLGYNFAPVLSPDGTLMVVLSQQDILSLDLYLVEVDGGRVLRRLAGSRGDTHFDALRFIDSAGAWSPDGRRFACVVYREGDNQLTIIDVADGGIERTAAVPGVPSFTNLAWSPDGRTIAVAGSVDGASDLFLYDVASGDVRRLTDDRYAELSPAWSPDGRTLAFATDRVDTVDGGAPRFGDLQLGLLDVAGGELRLLRMAPGVKHIDPRFAPDGRAVYCVSDPGGISDVFRCDLDTGAWRRVTAVATGVTGLTADSPALSVASRSGDLAFTVFDDGEYPVRLLPAGEAGGEPIAADAADGADLPPPGDEPGVVDAYLGRGAGTMLSDTDYERRRYRPGLALSGVSQVGAGVAVDRFGTSAGGWAALLFTDMLGDRALTATVRGGGDLATLGGQASYTFLGDRLNKGVGLGHIPYRTGYSTLLATTATIDGTTYDTVTERLRLQTITLDQAYGVLEYPFSTNRRLELSVGFSHFSFSQEVREAEWLGGALIDYREYDEPAPPPLNLVEGSVAYVGDYSYFGLTSPIAGKRFRLEISPTTGSLQYAGLLLDYRHYHYASPLTLAVRGLHYGRYFGDGQSDHLVPLYLGQETLVRGYALDSFDVRRCIDVGGGGCTDVDRMTGSRLAVFNLEARLPLLGTEDFGLLDFPYLPLEVSAFLDGGAVWTRDDPVLWTIRRESDRRIPVFSAGAAFRLNILGALVGQIYLAYPFQRPEKDHLWGFVLAPGW